MIEIIDNFLDESFSKYLSNAVCGVDWNYRHNISLGTDSNDAYMHGFNRVLFDSHSSTSFEDRKADIFIPVILKIEETFKLNPGSLVRSRLDMTVRSPKNTIHDVHKDYDFDHYGCILYMNDSDGDTVIYNETSKSDSYTVQKTISPKRNRLVFFDGKYYHTGHSPSQNNYRILLNSDFYK
jgi:hypothetical protein